MTLHFTRHGSSVGPIVFLGGSLGSTHRQWDELVDALSPSATVIAFDHRGHGSSPAAASGVGVRDLAEDVVALADHLDVETFSYVGISLGGAVGQQLALHHPTRLDSVVLACTSAWFGGPDAWNERAALVRSSGMTVLREPTGQRWFNDVVATTPRAQAILDDLVATDPESYAACCEALAAYDAREQIPRITTRTLIIGADQDPVSPPQVIADLGRVPGSAITTIGHSRHLANINQPQAFNSAVRAFVAP